MKDLGKRLNELASNATTGTSLRDPSHIAPPERRSQRGLSMAMALVGVVAVAFMLFLWQGSDSGTTSVAAGQVQDEAAEFLDDETCSGDSALALLRAGIPTHDYEPAGSFDALANQSAAVVVGQVASIARTEVNGRSYIEIMVTAVVDVPFATGVDTPRPDIQIIAYEAEWADSSSPGPLASPVAVERLDFFGFLSPWSGVRDGWAPGPEGLYVSCNGGGVPVLANAAGPNDPTNPGEWWAVKATQQAEGQAMADAAAAAEAARLEAERAAAGGAAPPTEVFLHTVVVGDRLGSIAEQYNVTVDVIIRANPQMDPNVIIAGEQLVIPGAQTNLDLLESVGGTGLDASAPEPRVTPVPLDDGPGDPPLEHEVVAGDSISAIAQRYMVTISQIVDANGLTDSGNALQVGQILLIPPPFPEVAIPATPATPEDLQGLQQAMIERARERWNSLAVDSYVLRYAEFRPEGPAVLVAVTVEDGVIAFLDWDKPDLVGSVYTVDALFDLALSADTVREFESDPQTGYPTVLSVDPDSTVAGDEFVIRSIEVIPSPPTS